MKTEYKLWTLVYSDGFATQIGVPLLATGEDELEELRALCWLPRGKPVRVKVTVETEES